MPEWECLVKMPFLSDLMRVFMANSYEVKDGTVGFLYVWKISAHMV